MASDKSFTKYMDETGILNRWQILQIGMVGTFVGVIIGVLFALSVVI